MTDADTPSAVRVLQRNSLPHELRDYALLADGQRGILADPDGELAWMCFPTWSDPAVLASLLGSERLLPDPTKRALCARRRL